MNDFVKKVLDYYEFVDELDIDKVKNLFSEDIIYLRCEKEIKGINDLVNFYKKKER